MKILKSGDMLVKILECPACGCVFEITALECTVEYYDPIDMGRFRAHGICPCCGTKSVFHSSQFKRVVRKSDEQDIMKDIFNDWSMILGRGIRELREERGLKQKELSEKVGISQTSMSMIERGVRHLRKRI